MHTGLKGQAISLYKSAFDCDNSREAECFIELFFEDILFLKGNNEITSQLFLIDAEYKDVKRTAKLKYIYAAATVAKHRRKGLMSKLISLAEDKAKREGYAGIYLYPADDDLRKYYKKLGFKDCFKTKNGSSSRIIPCKKFTDFCSAVLNSEKMQTDDLAMAIIFDDKIDRNAVITELGN